MEAQAAATGIATLVIGENSAWPQSLEDGLARTFGDQGIAAIILKFAGDPGEEVNEDAVTRLAAEIEGSPKRVIALITRPLKGAALALSLACHARIASSAALFSFPEAGLGLIPGAGVTQRLPRLVGALAAIEMLTAGKPVSAEKALHAGLVDRISADAEAQAMRLLRETTETPRSARDAGIDPAALAKIRADQLRKARGRLAPIAIVDCVEAAGRLPLADGIAFEADRLRDLMASDQHAALAHYAAAEAEAAIIPDLPPGTEAARIDSCAIIGAGTMGGGIAMAMANAGIDVMLLDLDRAALDRGLAVIGRNYDISVSRGSMARGAADRALSRIRSTTVYADLGQCDMAIEAATERLDVKQRIFATLDGVMKPGAILATNTSYLDIDAIAAATGRPDAVIGCHFFSPANIMKLLENVRGRDSAPRTIATAMALGRRIGKIPVLAGNCEGFIGNRMLQYYTGEAEFLLEQGASPEQVDRVANAFGMAMGPIAMRDLAGMDMAVISRADRARRLPPGERMSPIVERLVEAGRLGQKNGKGFYRYEGREKFSDPETDAIIAQVAADHGIERRAFTDAEVEARLFAPLVNEGLKILEDGIALRAGDIDVVWVNGYNFPAHRGGPMFWGERFGWGRILDLARDAARRNGPRWGPSALLERLVAEKGA